MAEAKISSTEVIRVFRTAMIKFAENAGAALGNADSDVNRALMWLDLSPSGRRRWPRRRNGCG